MNSMTTLLRVKYILGVLMICLTFFNCSNDDPTPATTGKISGSVTTVSGSVAVADATVILFDANTNAPISTTKTDASGSFSFDVIEGNYFIKIYKQDYESVPPLGIEPVPFSVTLGETTTQSAEMSPSLLDNLGYITGKVSVGAAGKQGVLVIAEGAGSGYSAITDTEGDYIIFNVPAAVYSVKGYLANFVSTSVDATVTASTATNGVDLGLTEGSAGQVTGTFKVISQTTIATPPADMDISLVHPITKESIPGLSQRVPYSSSLSYTFSNVPDGTYVVRASYANDYIVIDPDYITKFGDYQVTITGGTSSPSSVDIVATSAVILQTPSNEMITTAPVDATLTPTFQWSAYPSTSDYVIEVTDASTGAVIWGGFTKDGGTLIKNISIPSNTTSITFNADGNAAAPLAAGKVYRWRIFASKDNAQTDSWNLIAASEDQMGLIKTN